MKKIFLTISFSLMTLLASAQSQSFEIGKWTEIRNAVMKNLCESYVDSLPVGRIESAAMSAMLKELDPYTIYVPEEENSDFRMAISNTYGGIGAIIYKPDVNGPVIINEPYENSPASRNGLTCADEVIAIDGVTTAGLDASQSSLRMRGEPGTQVRLTVRKLRTGDTVDVNVIREKIHIPNVPYYSVLDGNVGYIVLTGFTDGAADEVRNALISLRKKCNLQKLVLDLRGNGGGLFGEAINIVSLFVPKGSLVVSSKGSETNSYHTQTPPVDTKVPMIVLVDSGSASASEIVSGALQDLDRATIMGQRTFGKGLVQSIRPLPYGGQLKLTTAKYYTPSGRCVQAIDYSNRRPDGSVGHIPDSLTREFHTSKGRTVRDGGGITPDVILDTAAYSRLTYSLVLYGVIDRYAIEYYRSHESIPEPELFHFSDADYEDFIEYAVTQNFDSRSSAKAQYDDMVRELKRDGLDEKAGEALASLDRILNMDKESFLRMKKDEIIPFIEEEVVVRYYFQGAFYAIKSRGDTQLRQALSSPLVKY